jgi:hypothetical protein
MEHYRAHRVYCSTTGHERISDTVDFFPQHCKVPGISSTNATTIAAAYLTHALQNPTPTTPFKQPVTERMQAIKKVSRHLRGNCTTTRANTKGGYNREKYKPTSKGGNSVNAQSHNSKGARNTNTTPCNYQ